MVAIMDGPQEVSTYRPVDWRRYATAKLSTEYDSEGSVFVNKFSSRVLNGLAKITGSFQREASGDLRYPLLGVVTKYLSVLYDHEDKNALVTLSADVGRNVQVKYLQDVKVGSPPSEFVLIVLVIRESTENYCRLWCHLWVAILGPPFTMTMKLWGPLKLIWRLSLGELNLNVVWSWAFECSVRRMPPVSLQEAISLPSYSCWPSYIIKHGLSWSLGFVLDSPLWGWLDTKSKQTTEHMPCRHVRLFIHSKLPSSSSYSVKWSGTIVGIS